MLYDYTKWEEDWEIKQYQQFTKKHNRLYRELHNLYTNQGGVKKPLAVDRVTFADAEKSLD